MVPRFPFIRSDQAFELVLEIVDGLKYFLLGRYDSERLYRHWKKSVRE